VTVMGKGLAISRKMPPLTFLILPYMVNEF
jgi:hypothetical protein